MKIKTFSGGLKTERQTCMSGIIVLFKNTEYLETWKHRDCILLLTVLKAEFLSQLSHLDTLQDIGFIP